MQLGIRSPIRYDTYLAAVLADSPYLVWPLDDSSGATARDLSINGRSGTITGTVAYGAAGPVPNYNAINFNTADDYVVSPGIFNQADATIECWIKTTANTFQICGCENGFGTGTYDKALGVTAAGVARAYAFDGGQRVTDGTKIVNDGSWHYVAFTVGGSFLSLYVDGLLDGAPVSCGSSYTGYTVPNVFTAGKNDGQRGFNWGSGLRAWMAVYPSALSAARIAAHRNAHNA